MILERCSDFDVDKWYEKVGLVILLVLVALANFYASAWWTNFKLWAIGE